MVVAIKNCITTRFLALSEVVTFQHAFSVLNRQIKYRCIMIINNLNYILKAIFLFLLYEIKSYVDKFYKNLSTLLNFLFIL